MLDQLEATTGTRFPLIESDVSDSAKLEEASKTNYVEAVIHSAGLKAGGRSRDRWSVTTTISLTPI